MREFQKKIKYLNEQAIEKYEKEKLKKQQELDQNMKHQKSISI